MHQSKPDSPRPAPAVYRFAGYTLDVTAGALLSDRGEKVELRPKTAELLRHLAQRAGKVVSRDELMEAVWPSVVVTDDSITQCVAEIRRALGKQGTALLRTLPKRGYLLSAEVTEAGEPTAPPASSVAPHPYLNWSSRPTLAVLPFRNVGGTEADSYFGEGITEDIITGLAQSRALYVISRTSTLRYRDHGRDIQIIARELNVRYLIDGSVRRDGNRLRITVELVDVPANRTIWGNHFDGFAENLFEFQDRIATSIIGALEPHLQAAEIARVKGRPTDSLDAYDCVLKALSQLYVFTSATYREAGELLDKAIALDPNYAQAHAYRAWHLVFWVGEEMSSDPEGDRRRAIEMARRARMLDPQDAFVLCVAGHVTAFFEGDPAAALELFDAALAINENSAFGWALSALSLAYEGRAEEALERVRNVWRLSPFDPLTFYFQIIPGIAEFVAGRYAEAVGWLRRTHRTNPRFVAGLRMLAASLALLGDGAAARRVGQELLATQPQFRISTFLAWYPLKRPGDLARLAEGLRLAGLPE